MMRVATSACGGGDKVRAFSACTTHYCCVVVLFCRQQTLNKRCVILLSAVGECVVLLLSPSKDLVAAGPQVEAWPAVPTLGAQLEAKQPSKLREILNVRLHDERYRCRTTAGPLAHQLYCDLLSQMYHYSLLLRKCFIRQLADEVPSFMLASSFILFTLVGVAGGRQSKACGWDLYGRRCEKDEHLLHCFFSPYAAVLCSVGPFPHAYWCAR